MNSFARALCSLSLLLALSAAAQEEGPAKIRDNLFLLEEAYNQEPGVIQHIQVFALSPRTGSWDYSFTEEWPVPTDRHQLSITVPLAGGGGQGVGIGDLLLNYRLQVLGLGGQGKIAAAPRLSAVLPTGDWRTGAGRGALGVQFNLPVSIDVNDFLVTHLNAGATFTPSARSPDDQRGSLLDTNAGVALVWLLQPWFNVLVEGVHLTEEELLADGSRSRAQAFVLNPGIRGAIDVAGGLQIVPGLSMPIEFGDGGPTLGVLMYLSLEHPLWAP